MRERKRASERERERERGRQREREESTSSCTSRIMNTGLNSSALTANWLSITKL